MGRYCRFKDGRPMVLCLMIAICLSVFLTKHGGSCNTGHGFSKERTSFNVKRLIDSRPSNADPDFDCKVRQLAWEYAQKIQPDKDLESVFNALELQTKCNQSLSYFPNNKPYSRSQHLLSHHSPHRRVRDSSFYVDVNNGKDFNDGSLQYPFQTIAHAVAVSRSVAAPVTIFLRKGTYYLSETINLGPGDSGLAISSYQGEEVYVSGGIPLVTTWKPYKVDPTPRTRLYPNTNNVFGIAESRKDSNNLKYFGDFDNVNQCQNACLTYNQNNRRCYSFTFHHPDIGTTWAKQCFGVLDTRWTPVAESKATSGRIINSNIYSASLQGQGIRSIPGLQLENGGKRATRARYPDGDTETSFFPSGWLSTPEGWFPPINYGPSKTLLVPEPQRKEMVMFQNYSIGIGGSCSIYDPPESYWCSQYNDGGGPGLFEVPTGLIYPQGTFGDRVWKNPKGAIVHLWHPYHWGLWMFALDSHFPQNRSLKWTYGGFQEARGSAAGGDQKGSDWFVENIFEELDSPNEYFYDESTETLYWFYNDTENKAPPSDLKLVATNLKVLFNVTGERFNPVTDVTFRGINFVASASTFMDPHGVPSGGDWALQRTGAVFLENTDRCKIEWCLFRRLDGNALVISGYNRNTTVVNSEFNWIGDSAMVSWGYTNYIDGTDGNQPRYTNILNNIVHELGHFEKQASHWFQAKSCLTLIKNNIFFNGPRALINFNDGFGGGNEIAENLLFNANRESSDHGPFNSWDRMPFVTELRDGTPSLTPLYNEIHHNFFIANYGSNMCIDNDDGSSWYLNHDNFEVYGGHKSNFGGHNKFHYNAINAFAQVYEEGVCNGIGTAQVPSFVDGYYNNTCIQGRLTHYADISPCDSNNPDPSLLPESHDNRVYNAEAKATVRCNGVTLTEEEWQSKGQDKNTAAFPLPTSDQIIAWARPLLGL